MPNKTKKLKLVKKSASSPTLTFRTPAFREGVVGEDPFFPSKPKPKKPTAAQVHYANARILGDFFGSL